MSERIYLSPPHLGQKEREYVQQAFDTNWIAPLGPNVDGFERDIQDYHGGGYAAALSSGTAALHLAMELLGVQSGDIVLVQSLTFCASVNPILYNNATPIFIGSESETWNMDPQALRLALETIKSEGDLAKVKAIIPVHLYGMPSNLDSIMNIAREFNIPIIEDAAESLGAKVNDRLTGTFGLMSIFSFNGNKIITTSGGGALYSKEHVEYINRARFLATQARENAEYYQHEVVGYNYRLSNILAGIGRGQMSVLNDRISARRAVYDRYKLLFSDIKSQQGLEFEFQEEPEGYFSNRWLTVVRLTGNKPEGYSCSALIESLAAENIEARRVWKPMHMQPLYTDQRYFGTKFEELLFEEGICLPSGSSLTSEQFSRIEHAIRSFLKRFK